MVATKQILTRCAVRVIRPVSRFLLLRTVGRCRVAAVWELKSRAMLVQQD